MPPMTALRRFDCALAPTKEKVLADYESLKDKLKGAPLNATAGQRFHNRSPLDRLKGDPDRIAPRLASYIQGFSANVRRIFEYFEFGNEIDRMREANHLVVSRFLRRGPAPGHDCEPANGPCCGRQPNGHGERRVRVARLELANVRAVKAAEVSLPPRLQPRRRGQRGRQDHRSRRLGRLPFRGGPTRQRAKESRRAFRGRRHPKGRRRTGCRMRHRKRRRKRTARLRAP